jgi:hypothetical protein
MCLNIILNITTYEKISNVQYDGRKNSNKNDKMLLTLEAYILKSIQAIMMRFLMLIKQV